MKKSTIGAALLALGMLPAVSYSATPQNNPSGPYLGAGWGQFALNIRNLDDVGTATSNIVDEKNNAWKIFAGYRMNPYLAFEAAYIDFGRANGRFVGTGSDGNYQVEISGFAPTVIGSIPLGRAELFLKGGTYLYNVKVNANFDNPNPGVNSSHTRNDFLFGGGVGVTIADHFHLRAEYETIELKNAANSDAFWLSGAWRF